MVEWSSPEAIASAGGVYKDFVHALFGLYIWELLISMKFDYEYLVGKRRFKWPMTFYFLNRYLMFANFLGIILWTDITNPLNCVALFICIQVFANLSLGLAGINLALRTMAIWKMSRYIVVPLAAVIVGHLSLLLLSGVGVPLRSLWVQGEGCISNSNSILMLTTLIYTICFNLVVLVLTAWGLTYKLGDRRRSRVATLIFKDGLIFFIAALLVDILAIIFIALDMNPIMLTLANVLPTTLSTIIACRAVRRLANFTNHDVETLGRTSASAHRVRPSEASIITSSHKVQDGVHIHMETIVHSSDALPSEVPALRNETMSSATVYNEDWDTEANSVFEIKQPDL
ncbi:hypothetical protein OBBRIDRAFT_401328 [Obba rivulosa]|uniref:Transmembrane protein n=1 Tax=Obba rivulosa TaxID=1052685 RepID=A0A8E2ASL8_9APHY|nr:hypothetical protein OBBRIDRAFT_401328 [Obba rivulosa]